MQQNRYSTRQEVSGTFGAVASTHWIATQVGMSLLEKGGNAFDAAAAVAFTLQVVEPHQNSLGGESVILIYPNGAFAPTVVCGQGVAPAAANIPYFRSLGLKHIPLNGLLAAVVPGAFDAWMIMFRDYGTKTLEDILSPAIAYAQNGVPLVTEAHERIARSAPFFREHWASSASVYLPGNLIPQAGELFRNPALSDTYLKILRTASHASGDRVKQIEAARNTFYRGFVAEKVCRFCKMTAVKCSTGQSHFGLLDQDDMGSWEATYETPESIVFNGLRIFKPGGWTQGPAFLQLLALVQGLNIFDLDPFGSEYVHTLVEASKLAYADREAWCGDAGPNNVTVSDLLEEGYIAQRRQLISSNASMDLRPGSPKRQVPQMPCYETHISGGLGETMTSLAAPARPGEGDTCHLDVIDRWGNAVAATPSGGWLYGSPVIPELGFSLSTRAQMFWLQEGLRSSLAPRTRPRTTLSPTIALDDCQAIAFGTRGADYQDQWIAQFFLHHVGFSMDLQEAWDAPKFHSDHWPRSDFPRDASPGKLTLDERYAQTILEELRGRGHLAKIQRGRLWGRGCAAKISGGILRAGTSSAVAPSLAVAR
jgi:gamma-glutamyltranspeptidase / glutathione hydrolase